MRKNKVSPSDYVREQPIDAYGLGYTSVRRTHAVSSQPLVGVQRHPLIAAFATESESTLSTISQSSVADDKEQPVEAVAICTIAEERMAEQSDVKSNASNADKDLLNYFTELNNDENHEIDMDLATRILLEGADVNAKSSNGQTCVHLAAAHWQKEVVEFLKEKGANLHETDDFGVTALHKAARVDNEEVVSYLVEDNSSISQVTTDTLQTALHYAVLGNAVNSIYVCKPLTS